jgi:hypothetical protein
LQAARSCARIRIAARTLRAGMVGIIRGMRQGVNDDLEAQETTEGEH